MLSSPPEYRKHTGGKPFSPESLKKVMENLGSGDLDIAQHGAVTKADMTWLGSLSPKAQDTSSFDLSKKLSCVRPSSSPVIAAIVHVMSQCLVD